MTKSVFSVVWILFLCSVDGYLGSLEDIPRKMPYVRSERLLGTWYRFAHYIPCSWNGASQFSDGVSKIIVDKSDPHMLTVVNTWRSNGQCAERIEKISRACIENNTVQSFNSLGGMGSGLRVRVAIDYDEFDVNYGCAKLSIDDPRKCDDPSLSGLKMKLSSDNPRNLSPVEGVGVHGLMIVCPSSC